VPASRAENPFQERVTGGDAPPAARFRDRFSAVEPVRLNVLLNGAGRAESDA
jgi:hypothetical protein